ncbi:U11/U12 small nuclear ribonucleoprotein 25 kDa protein isoform X1 [Neoarius graeffei]|uniref:U11/U12 small nuclear ribonucleoprotein 25 kDa protein isoform X1 n=1 Tax=Neoarius graeffei TaxID=443677 RepID=UPI00298BE8C4|nr:U11/U12 small nuclear ribonucleoprotein 25 kDa protein isoform X1 [Neoarius graeffei]
MGAVSKQQELQRISLELHKVTLQIQQLNNRLHLLALMKEVRENVGCHKEVNDPTETDEYEKIEEELNKLLEKKLSLQALQEKLEGTSDDACSTVQKHEPLSTEIFIVEKPPSYPAPQIILEINKLSRYPSQTQCPYCEQYITTEVSTVIGNTTWLMCLASAFIGCIAGCCLIPFCISEFKDVVHKCPKCRSHIHTSTKM